MTALEAAGLAETTTVVYSSDHGDNVGARGLWGKSQLYQESTAIPMVMAGPGIAPGICETPVSLLDVSVTIAQHFGTAIQAAPGTDSLAAIAARPADPERVVLSEYHAVGAVSGAFMLRKGRWKLHHYVGFPPELFDLTEDPEEMYNLAPEPAMAQTLAMMQAELRAICDPDAVNAQAFADQDALIQRHGGRAAALKLGAPGATPPPSVGARA